jgi:hypothetical protein
VVWKDFDEVISMCLKGIIYEDTTVAVLMQFLNKKTI